MKYKLKNKKCFGCKKQGYMKCETDKCNKYACFQCYIKCRECSKRICENCEVMDYSIQDPDHNCYDCYIKINDWTNIERAVLYRDSLKRKKN